MKARQKHKKGRQKHKKQIGVEDLKNQLARALADYDNLRKRVEKQQGDFEKLVSAKFALRILPIFDMLEEAQKHLKDSGIALTIEEFRKILKEEEIEEIKGDPGEKFDEEFHEAVEVVSPPAGGKKEDGLISEVILPGWKFTEGPTIRPAKVKVYRKIQK